MRHFDTSRGNTWWDTIRHYAWVTSITNTRACRDIITRYRAQAVSLDLLGCRWVGLNSVSFRPHIPILNNHVSFLDLWFEHSWLEDGGLWGRRSGSDSDGCQLCSGGRLLYVLRVEKKVLFTVLGEGYPRAPTHPGPSPSLRSSQKITWNTLDRCHVKMFAS